MALSEESAIIPGVQVSCRKSEEVNKKRVIWSPSRGMFFSVWRRQILP